MRKREKRRLLFVTFFVVLILLCGTVAAYMFKQTEYEANQFTPAEVSCQVHEVTDAGVTQKSSITVENTGNINAYLRIRLVSYWVQVTEEGQVEIAPKASVMPVVNVAEGWIKGTDHTYYYQSPVAPDDFTGELLSSPIVLAEEEGYLQVVEVFAEAIQSEPERAVVNSWGVSLDEDVITTAP